jgi:hypothetical protein
MLTFNSRKRIRRFSQVALSRPGYIAAGFIALLSLCLWIFIIRNYSIRAYSDPLNWLFFAQHLASECSRSRLAIGYPMFLFSQTPLWGPYYIFLVNFPLLILLFILVLLLAWLIAQETTPPHEAVWIGIGAFSFLAAVDLYDLIFLTNPYRDPLAYVGIVGSMVFLLRYLQNPRHSRWRIAVSGLLLGGAYCVREPSILMFGPLALTGFVYWWSDRTIPLWKSIGWFTVFFVLGGLPLFIQSQISTGQFILPAQSVKQGSLAPGILPYQSIFFPIAKRFLSAYWEQGGIFMPACIAGLLFAVIRRNRLLLLLIVPSVVGYFIFYSFYWPGVRRYFYLVTVLAMPLASYGLFHCLWAALRLLRRPQWSGYGNWLLASGISLWAAWRLLATQPATPPFQVPQAKQFKADLESTVPPDATIFCRRNLCEIIRYFTHAQSYPVPSESDLRRIVRDGLERGESFYFMEVKSRGAPDIDRNIIERSFSMEFVTNYHPAVYHLGKLGQTDVLPIYRIRSWSRPTMAQVIAPKPAPGLQILSLDVGSLWNAEYPDRRWARLSFNDRIISHQLMNGLNLFPVVVRDVAAAEVKLESDQPVPLDVAPRLLSPDEPIELDFFAYGKPSCLSLLSTNFMIPGRGISVPALHGSGRVAIPLPWPEDRIVFAAFLVREESSWTHPVMRVALTADGQSPIAVQLPEERVATPIVVPVQPASSSHAASVAIEVSTGKITRIQPFEVNESVGLELHRITLYPFQQRDRFLLDIGDATDIPFIREGFYPAEKKDGAETVRWTKGRALLDVYLDSPSNKVLLKVHYFGMRPAGAPDPHLEARFNSTVVVWDTVAASNSQGALVNCAVVSAASVNHGLNRLELLSQPWQPSRYRKTNDARELGILLDRIVISPLPP